MLKCNLTTLYHNVGSYKLQIEKFTWLYQINKVLVYCLSFNLREKWYPTVVHLYDGGCKFTAVLEVTCLNVALKVSKSLIPQHWELQTVELHD